MSLRSADTGQLLDAAQQGNTAAIDLLLQRYRQRLKGMASIRLDPRVLQRVDPSDIVQETLIEAHRRLPEYLQSRPIPFYPWLRGIAWNRLVDHHRKHVQSQRRTVTRESHLAWRVSNKTTGMLLKQLTVQESSPLHAMVEGELHSRLLKSLGELTEIDREVLILRHLEQLSVSDTAVVLGIAEGTVKSRHYRALERLRQQLLDETSRGEQ